uniref:Polyadenylate-binding protein 2 n=1 Tax=Noccaea caerulescens TaxID=107243 RepID=A0A1J3J9V0_NOCCA
MASYSKESATKVNLFGKRNPEDDLETKPFLKKHKETSYQTEDDKEEETTEGFADHESAVTGKTLFICRLHYKTKISDIIDFFKNVVQVVRVRLTVNGRCLNLLYGLVEFASANEANKALEKKNGQYLLGSQIKLFAAKKTPKRPRPKFCIEHKVCYEDYLGRESLPIEEDETQEVLFVANLSPQTKISDIQHFFEDVVSVRLIVNPEGKHVGYAFVDFASADEAKKALKKKNGEYLHDHKIFLQVAKTAPYPPRPKYNLAEKLCYEDYLRRQNLVIQEDETLDETPNFVEAVAVRKKTLFVSGLSHEAEISDIINFFKDVGQVFCLRLIVDYTGKHVGDGFVEFSSANEAEKALEKKNGEYLHDHKIYIDVAKKAPYPLRPKYCIDHKVWYEDYLRQENLLIEENEAVEGDDKILEYIEEVAARRKTLFIANIPCKTSIPTIVHSFKNVGRVALLRLIVDHRGQRVGCGFVEFNYAKEAEKALKKMSNLEFSLDVAEIAPYPLRPKYNLAEKLWSKVESLLVEEEEEEEEEEAEVEEAEVEDEEEEAEVEDYDLETKPDLKKQVVPMMMGGVCCKKVTFCYDE